MAIDLGRVGLGHREAMAPGQLLESALERPETEVEAVAQRRRDQVAPAGDRRLADLVDAERPEQRAGGVAGRGAAVAPSQQGFPWLEAESVEQLPAPAATRMVGIEGPGDADLLG